MTHLAGVLDYDPGKLGLVPEHLRPGLRAYMEDGRATGDALWHVLADRPLSECVVRLDEAELSGVLGLVRWLYNYAPGRSWGSPEAVEAWGLMGGLRGYLRWRDNTGEGAGVRA